MWYLNPYYIEPFSMRHNTCMDFQYPVGRFEWPGAPLTAAQRNDLIDQIEAAPANVRAAVARLSGTGLDTPYRPGGWTARQVVHHLADSHMNSYMRFKLALTQTEPPVKAYDQDAWGALADSNAPVDVSLDLLDALHRRWVILLRSLSQQDFARCFVHSEIGKVSLDRNLALYAWHGRHHTAHILSIAESAAKATSR